MAEVEIFTPTGVLAGLTAGTPLTDGGPDLLARLRVQEGRWYPIDGGPPSYRGDTGVEPDDILVIATPEPELRVHMASYSVTLDVGPYRVSGSLATHPGFDPARALARPSTGFVALHGATIELLGQPGAGVAERAYVHVNRYAVESVSSSLMLGFYFPGARLLEQEPVTAA
jgi:hypothetical protein